MIKYIQIFNIIKKPKDNEYCVISSVILSNSIFVNSKKYIILEYF